MARPSQISKRIACGIQNKYITPRFTHPSDRGQGVGDQRVQTRTTPLRQSARKNARQGDGIQETGIV